MTDHDTKQALIQGVIDNPTDNDRKLILADWLEEHGEGDLAHAFRWAAAKDRHPRRSPAGKNYLWTCSGPHDGIRKIWTRSARCSSTRIL